MKGNLICIEDDIETEISLSEIKNRLRKFVQRYPWHKSNVKTIIPFSPDIYRSRDFETYYGSCAKSLNGYSRVVGQIVMWKTSTFINLSLECKQKIAWVKKVLGVNFEHENAYDLVRTQFRYQLVCTHFLPMAWIHVISRALGILCMPDTTVIGSKELRNLCNADPRPENGIDEEFIELLNDAYSARFLLFLESWST